MVTMSKTQKKKKKGGGLALSTIWNLKLFFDEGLSQIECGSEMNDTKDTLSCSARGSTVYGIEVQRSPPPSKLSASIMCVSLRLKFPS